MSDKDYNSISQNLKQQIDILKTGNELTGSTSGSVSIGTPCNGPASFGPGSAVGEKDKLGMDTTSDRTIGGIGIGSSGGSSLRSALGDREAVVSKGGDQGGYVGENIKIHDRLLNFTTSERGEKKVIPTDFFLDYYYYIYSILLIGILFLIYIFIKLLKPSYIYKNVLRENKKNKYKDIDIDYNKMYNIISVIYIVILILLFVNKQTIDYTIDYILKKLY